MNSKRISVTCETCKKVFEIRERYYIKSKSKKFYCCRKCKDIGQRKPGICLFCGAVTKKRKKFCTIHHQQDYLYTEYIKKWKLGLVDGCKEGGTSGYIKRYIKEKYNDSCSICGWKEINPWSKNVPVELEHIDGNHKNNAESNLGLLCPNHHSLTKTYRGLNKGHGRHSRMERYRKGLSY